MKTNYRIHRTDSKNIAIQRQASADNWVTVSYHGHSLKSLIVGLHGLIMDDFIPDSDNILQTLQRLELAHAKTTSDIKEMLEAIKDI